MFIKALLLSLAFATPANAREVFIYFLCGTSDQAVAFVQGDSTEGCSTLMNVEMPKRVAKLLEITELLTVNGYAVEVGKVQIGSTTGYSAGKAGGLFS